MKIKNLHTKLFLDGGNPAETRELIGLLGFLDGQTTNPTLIAKNPLAQERLEEGKKFTKEEIFDFYRKVVKELSLLIPHGSISIEVYADKDTRHDQMLAQAREMFSWIPNAHIKFPTTREGIRAARGALAEGMRVNMTLCFSQAQAAAVYVATKGAKRGDVFISPFVGRLDDRGENGMDLIKNIIAMYKIGDGHVQVLSASMRNMNHFLYAIQLESDIITAPFVLLKEWIQKGRRAPDSNFVYAASSPQRAISYEEHDLLQNWESFEISHELTDKGIERFSQDWNSLIALAKK